LEPVAVRVVRDVLRVVAAEVDARRLDRQDPTVLRREHLLAVLRELRPDALVPSDAGIASKRYMIEDPRLLVRAPRDQLQLESVVLRVDSESQHHSAGGDGVFAVRLAALQQPRSLDLGSGVRPGL